VRNYLIKNIPNCFEKVKIKRCSLNCKGVCTHPHTFPMRAYLQANVGTAAGFPETRSRVFGVRAIAVDEGKWRTLYVRSKYNDELHIRVANRFIESIIRFVFLLCGGGHILSAPLAFLFTNR
jgi:hypothetical protein